MDAFIAAAIAHVAFVVAATTVVALVVACYKCEAAGAKTGPPPVRIIGKIRI